MSVGMGRSNRFSVCGNTWQHTGKKSCVCSSGPQAHTARIRLGCWHTGKHGPYLHPKLQVSRKSLSLLPRRRNPSPTIPTMNCSDEETRSLLPLPSPIPTEGSFVPPQKHLSHFQSLPQMFALQHSPPSTQHVAPRTLNSITPPGPPHQTLPKFSTQPPAFLPSYPLLPQRLSLTPCNSHSPRILRNPTRGPQLQCSLPIAPPGPVLPHNSTHGPQPLYFLSTPLFPQHSSNPTILFSATQGPQLLRRPHKPHTRPLEPHTRLPNSTQRSPNPTQRSKPHRSASPRLPHQYLRMAVTCSGLGCSG